MYGENNEILAENTLFCPFLPPHIMWVMGIFHGWGDEQIRVSPG